MFFYYILSLNFGLFVTSFAPITLINLESDIVVHKNWLPWNYLFNPFKLHADIPTVYSMREKHEIKIFLIYFPSCFKD